MNGLGLAAFDYASGGPLFVAAAEERASRFIDERQTNHCYHLEVQ